MQAYLAENFFEERQARELAEPTRIVWFAEDSHRNAIGYVMFRLGTRASGVHGERPAEVERIYVDRSSHRSGVGSRLMNACIEQAVASGCDVLWLAVWERNARAIAFYEQFGFRKVGAKDFQLGSDVQRDAVMERLL
jgi:ribosomal protein S18 acetylase RimI-like enzyme